MLRPRNSPTNADLGVLLLNFGGPQTLAEVRPFLFTLFSDPDIIRIKNDRLRRTIAWLIATIRQRKSRRLYRQIGGGSPLRSITEAQAAALGTLLAGRGCRARVYVGMRCWQPSIDEAVARIAAAPVGRLVVLPLFPQFSITTTGSCLNYFRAVAEKAGLPDRMDIFCIPAWFEEPLYLESVAKQIRKAQERFSTQTPGSIHLLYSAHSIPARYLEEGDPYLQHTRKTMELIDERLEGRFPSTLAFQSKIGPVKWLGPASKEVLAQLGRRGVSRVMVVPISFVSDHIETLQEIDIEYRRLAQKAGIREFHRASSLNTDPAFVEALAHISLQAAARMP